MNQYEYAIGIQVYRLWTGKDSYPADMLEVLVARHGFRIKIEGKTLTITLHSNESPRLT